MSGPSKDVEVSYDDQQNINRFSTCNTRLQDIKYDLDKKQTALTNLADAEDEMMLALDADEKLPFMFGEVFLLKTQEEASECLAAEKATLEGEVEALKARASELEASMAGLRTKLYAKFGTNIRLEDGDED